MATEGIRRRIKPQEYKILIVPAAEGGKTRSFHTTALTAVLVGVVAIVSVVALTLIVLVYTPLSRYVAIPNPDLEQRYSRDIVETQQRLADLTRDVLILKQYNVQLRKALGDQLSGDTSTASRSSARETYRPRGLRMENTPAAGRLALDSDRAGVRVSAELRPAEQGVARTALMASDRPEWPMLPPAEGFVSQRYDPAHGHFGVDYAGKQGAPFYAAADGYVLFAGWTYDDGNMLIISHGERYVTVYKHAQSLLKSAHASVRRGELIGLVGSSGHTSLGPHLHFEVWKNGVPSDPEQVVMALRKNQ